MRYSLKSLLPFYALLGITLLAACSHLSEEQRYYLRQWRQHCYYPLTGNAYQDQYNYGRCLDSYRLEKR